VAVTKSARTAKGALYKVRKSKIHGTGVFAARALAKGKRILEYTGERVDDAEAERRADVLRGEGALVLLFALDDGSCLDGGSGGSDARFVNHSCEPNCESVEEEGRIFLETVRRIRAGEELTYDYHLQHEGRRTAAVLRRYACRCGTPSCRGTMLAKKR